MEFAPVTENEVLKIIRSSPKKTCQLDPILAQVTIDYVHDLLRVITHIINRSLAFGHVPDSIKTALVTWLIKKPSLDREVLQNYRPVSNLTFMPNVLERVVCARLREYRAANCLLEPCQFAYRAHYSTETALLRVQNDLVVAVQGSCAAFLVLLDLSADFDTTDRSILLARLQSWFGIGRVALDWLASYLNDRVQRVNIKGVLSTQTELLLGVPQGSMLGPRLFSLYTAPISEIADRPGVSIHFYADDTYLYRTSALRFPTQTRSHRSCSRLKSASRRFVPGCCKTNSSSTT